MSHVDGVSLEKKPVSASSARSRNVGMDLSQTNSFVAALNAQPAGMVNLLTKIVAALNVQQKFAGTVNHASKKIIASALPVHCRLLTLTLNVGTESEETRTRTASAQMNPLSALLISALVATREIRMIAHVLLTLIAELMHHADLVTNSMTSIANVSQ